MPRIHVNDVELHYEERGSGTVPILFVHGFLGSTNTWVDEYMARLPEQYHSYAIDVRGHGQSNSIKQGCNLPQLANDVAEFARQLELEKFIYVGFSMGGAIGAQLVLDHPELVRALILSNPGLGSTVTGFYRLTLPIMARLSQNRWFMSNMFKNMVIHDHPAEFLERGVSEALQVPRETWTEYLNPSNKISDLMPFNTIDIPTLVLIGGKDNLLPLDMQHDLAAAFPRAKKVVFEAEGHIMVLEAPELVFGAMSSFLQELQ